MRGVSLSLAGLIWAAFFFGCGGDAERAPFLIGHGGGVGATVGTGASDGGTKDGGGADGGGTGGGTCQPNPATGTILAGDLSTFGDLTLGNSSLFPGKAIVTINGTPCGWATATYDGSKPSTPDPNRFELLGVLPADRLWLRMERAPGSTDDVARTLSSVTTANDLTLDDTFAMVKATQIEDVYTALGVTRDPSKATVVVQAIDLQTKGPASGALVSGPAADGIAIGSPGAWAAGAVTGVNGIAVLLNADALPTPGTTITIGVSYSAEKPSFPIAVEANAVTIASLGIGF